MKRRDLLPGLGLTLTLTLTLALGVSGCGSETVDPGGDTPIAPTTGAEAGDGDKGDTSAGDLLADTTGDSPFYVDSIDVTVAESHPVQLFLTVSGNAPTPAHVVAYTVEQAGDTLAVRITTRAGEGMAAQVLQPHEVVIPLGTAELPVTIDVNDGEFTQTVSP